MPLVYVGSQYILISAAENLVRKLLSYAVGFLIADLSGRKRLYQMVSEVSPLSRAFDSVKPNSISAV